MNKHRKEITFDLKVEDLKKRIWRGKLCERV